ncbi:hypothetical protein AHF37_06279 [Paragonimus kellicotti]|nr:hypothetical protein AHF37_06279 [Paragonimus kellicotti]
MTTVFGTYKKYETHFECDMATVYCLRPFTYPGLSIFMLISNHLYTSAVVSSNRRNRFFR